MSGAVAVLTQGARQRRNVAPRPVLIVDHAVAPAELAGKEYGPIRRAQRMVGEHVVAGHALRCHPIEHGGAYDRVAVGAEGTVALLVREHEHDIRPPAAHGPSVPARARAMIPAGDL